MMDEGVLHNCDAPRPPPTAPETATGGFCGFFCFVFFLIPRLVSVSGRQEPVPPRAIQFLSYLAICFTLFQVKQNSS